MNSKNPRRLIWLLVRYHWLTNLKNTSTVHIIIDLFCVSNLSICVAQLYILLPTKAISWNDLYKSSHTHLFLVQVPLTHKNDKQKQTKYSDFVTPTPLFILHTFIYLQTGVISIKCLVKILTDSFDWFTPTLWHFRITLSDLIYLFEL